MRDVVTHYIINDLMDLDDSNEVEAQVDRDEEVDERSLYDTNPLDALTYEDARQETPK